MPAYERPRLRPYLLPIHHPSAPPHFLRVYQLGLLPEPLPLPRRDFLPLLFLDGDRTLREVQGEVMRLSGGEIIPLETFTRLIDRLDRARLLDGPYFRAVADHPVREPRCIGCYEGEPDALRRQLERLFT